SCSEIFLSSAVMASRNVTVKFLFQVTVPFSASSVSVLINSSARDASVCFVAPIACSRNENDCSSVVGSNWFSNCVVIFLSLFRLRFFLTNLQFISQLG